MAAGLSLAEIAARRALELAPSLATAQSQLAYLESSQLNFPQALLHFRRALEVGPNDPDVLSDAAPFLAHMGERREALDLVERYIALDPLNAKAYRRKSTVLYALRDFPESIAAGRTALRMEPEQKGPNINIGYSLLLLGRPKEAEAAFRALPPEDAFRLTGETLVAARTGARVQAERLSATLWEQFGTAFSYQQAMVHAQLGERDKAFAYLERALAAKDPGFVYLKSDPFLDPIRDDARFAAIAKRLDVPS